MSNTKLNLSGISIEWANERQAPDSEMFLTAQLISARRPPNAIQRLYRFDCELSF